LKLTQLTKQEKEWLRDSSETPAVIKEAQNGLSAKYWASFYVVLAKVCLNLDIF